jgi:uncharacterized membrane protein
MNIPDALLPGSFYTGAWLLWVLSALFLAWRTPWRQLLDAEKSNIWLGMIVLLSVLWSLKAGVHPGLNIHLLGATVFTLSMGPYLAYFGVCLILAVVTFNQGGMWSAYAINALLMGGVSVLVSNIMLRLVQHFLPKHFFVYIFVNGFLGAAIAMLGVGFIACLVFSFSGVYQFNDLLEEYLLYFLLLGFSEAWLSGMVMTLFVVYRPAWVATFDDARYLANK